MTSCKKKDLEAPIQSMSFKYNGVYKECTGEIKAARSSQNQAISMLFKINQTEEVLMVVNTSNGTGNYSVDGKQTAILYRTEGMEYLANSGSVKIFTLSNTTAEGSFDSGSITEGVFKVNLR